MHSDPKKIKKRAKHLLKEGFIKKDVYSLLVQEFGNGEEVNNVIQHLPIPALEKKYRWINYTILLFLLISFCMQLMHIQAYIAFNILLILLIIFRAYRFFFLFCIAGGLTLCSIGFTLLSYHVSLIENPMLIVSILISVVHIIYGIAMPLLVNPKSENLHL